MAFDDGFKAIKDIQGSAHRLGETVERLDQLSVKLGTLQAMQADLEVALAAAQAAIARLGEVAVALDGRSGEVDRTLQTLPSRTKEVLTAAEKRLAKQHAAIAQVAENLPTLVEAAVQRQLAAIMAQLETHLGEPLRGEIRETRTSLREALEFGVNRNEARLADAKADIIAEMPRALFGVRGR